MQTTNQDKKLSERRIKASQENGKKSRGPVTPEGKARSSQNARKHGCLAAIITFTPEDEVAFNQIRNLYVQRFEPRDQAEHDLVEQIVYCNYQMREAWAQQAALIGLQVSMDKEKIDMEWTAPSELDRRSLALVESLKESNTIALLQRYSRALANQSERAAKMLLELKKHRLPPALTPTRPEAEAQLRNEPADEPQPSSVEPFDYENGDPVEAPISYFQGSTRQFRLHTPRQSPQPAPLLAMAA